MNAYFFKITKEERENILDKHKHVYDGYVTQYAKPNEQPLYVQDFANDKNGVTLTNDGNVSQYTNKVYMKESVDDMNIHDDWSTNYKEYEFDDNISQSEADSLIDQLYSKHPEMSKEDVADFVYNNVNIINDYDNIEEQFDDEFEKSKYPNKTKFNMEKDFPLDYWKKDVNYDDEDYDDEDYDNEDYDDEDMFSLTEKKMHEQFDDEFEKNKYPNKTKFNMEKDFPLDFWKKDIDYTMDDEDNYDEDDYDEDEDDMFSLTEKKENNLHEQLDKTLKMFDRLKKFN